MMTTSSNLLVPPPSLPWLLAPPRGSLSELCILSKASRSCSLLPTPPTRASVQPGPVTPRPRQEPTGRRCLQVLCSASALPLEQL